MLHCEVSEEESRLLLPTADRSAEQKEKHSQILRETEKVARAFVISSTLGWLTEGMLLTLYILFAKTLHGSTADLITLMVATQSVSQIAGILSSFFLADKYGFDRLSIVTSTVLLCGVVIQASSMSIWPFIVGTALKGLTMDDIDVLSTGFFGKLLPFNSAARYTACYYAMTTIGMQLGYVIGGAASIYLGYRLAFVVAAGIIFCRWLFILISIRDQQKPLVAKQMEFVAHYRELKAADNLVEHDCFPLCLESIKESEADLPEDNPHSNFAFYSEFALNLLQFGAVWGADLLVDQFIIAYFAESAEFQTVSRWLIVSMMMVLNTSFTSASFAMPSLIQNLDILRQYLLAVPLQMSEMLLFFFLFPAISRSQLFLFWIYFAIDGVVRAALGLTVELTVLELQPAGHAGKAAAARTLLRNGVAAISASSISALWQKDDHIWYWYCQGLLMVLSMSCTVVLIGMRLMTWMSTSQKDTLGTNGTTTPLLSEQTQGEGQNSTEQMLTTMEYGASKV